MKRTAALLALVLPLVALDSCAGKFPTYYDLDFSKYPIPVLLNKGSDEGRALTAKVKDSVFQANATMAYSYDSTDAGGTTWTHNVVETWKLADRKSTYDVPVAVQLYAASLPKDSSLSLKKIHLKDYVFFLMGVVAIETTLDVEAKAR
jgi:hypothetical protein